MNSSKTQIPAIRGASLLDLMQDSNMNSPKTQTPAALLEIGYQCYQAGNLPQAELLARQVMREQQDFAEAHVLLGLIALWVRMYDAATNHAQQALLIAPNNVNARQILDATAKGKSSKRTAAARPQGDSPSAKKKYLLIKSWGYGLWADVDHVLGQLLLSEMTGRIPVVHWGSNSLFRDSGIDDAFETLFEPVSDHKLADLVGNGLRYFPPKWSDTNIAANNVGKWDGTNSRMTGLYFLNRDEDIVVSDFHTYLADLVPWIDAGNALFGLTPQEIYRRIFAKYIKPRPDILNAVEQFWRSEMKDRHMLGIHVRGSDKVGEIPELSELNTSYQARISNYLNAHPQSSIFLLTDSESILSSYRQSYGQRLIYTDCLRTDTEQAVHYQDHSDKRRIGSDVIRDAYLAARCQYFIGNGSSNVSTSVLHMRDWDPSEYELVHENQLFTPNFLAHRR